jgi:hypothetical protein
MNFFGGVPHTGDPTQVTPTVDGYQNAAAYGHGTFPVYWMLNFFGECSCSFTQRSTTNPNYRRNDRTGSCLRERGHDSWTAMVCTRSDNYEQLAANHGTGPVYG